MGLSRQASREIMDKRDLPLDQRDILASTRLTAGPDRMPLVGVPANGEHYR